MKTAQLFYRGKREGNKSKYYLHNIVLGILGKTGGIPWVIKEMPGNVDCFVGLDVATLEKGIHYPHVRLYLIKVEDCLASINRRVHSAEKR